MKKTITFLSILLFVISGLFSQNISIWDGTDSTVWTQGSGGQSDPYLIETASQLAYLAASVNSGNSYIGVYFKLTTDIDLNGYDWPVIGNSNVNSFQGFFNGDDHSINDLRITLTGNSPVYAGLFGYLNNASVKKLHIIGEGNINLITNNTNTYYIGSIAGYSNAGSIDSCISSTNIIISRTATTSTTYNTYIGGLVGYAASVLATINHSLYQGTINYNFDLNYSNTSSYTWYHYIGGVIGYLTTGASVENSGHVNPINIVSNIQGYYKNSYIYAGGITGYMNGSSANPITIRRSYNRGNINLSLRTNHTYSSSNYSMSSVAYTGGIAGYSTAYNTISDCYNRTVLTPVLYAQSSYSSAYATSTAYTAGILGYMASTTSFTFTNCYNTAYIPETCTTSGNATSNLYNDALFYNTSAFAATNCYHLANCCSNNAHYSIAKTRNELRTLQMVHSLNVGTPGSGIWASDYIPNINNGYPIFNTAPYGFGLRTLEATDITGSSVSLHAFVDTNFIDLSSLDDIGFQYSFLGDSVYTSVSCSTDANPTLSLGQLTPCSSYVFRAYLVSGGQYLYGDTLGFTLLCHNLAQLDTTVCYGAPFLFNGQTYTQDGTYYQIVNNTTYTLNIHYYPSRENIITTSILQGEDYYVNGIAYNSSGTYTLNFDTDQHGCDSMVILTLFVIPTQVSQWDGGAQPWVFGDGTPGNPYRIENAGQFAYMSNEINNNSNAYNSAYFELVSDIDLNGFQWIGIGHSSSNPFQGHFDGNNHTIDNLNITVTGSTPVYIGLFGYLDSASVRNVHIIGNGTIDLNTNNTATYYVGPIAAYLNESQITNCSNSSGINITRTATSTTVYNTYSGGINGYATGPLSLIDQTLSQGSISYNFALSNSSSSSYSWYHYIGGTSGYLNNGASIDNSGRVNPINIVSDIRGYSKYSYIYTGGIVGYITGSSTNRVSVRKSYNRGPINLSVLTNHLYSSSSYNMYSYVYAGGIAGYSSAYNTISDCYNRGLITPNLYAQSSYSAAYATNNAYVAGILGFMASTTSFTLANSYNTANVPATCTTSGNATNNYYSDAIVYNNSAYAAANCYHLASCCANNAHYSISKIQSELRALQMIHNLNVGTPGSGIWTSDILPTTNNGYPIFDATPYGYAIYTRPATNITGSSASLNGYIDTNFMDISSLDDIGFQYALVGDTAYTSISCMPDALPSLSLGQLLPCSSYVYRAYVVTGGQYLYGNTVSFTVLCHTLDQIDTTICHGALFHFNGQTYLQDGTYYQIVNNTTYTLNIHYYPSRENTISASILQGEEYYVNGIAYNTSGTYTLRFATDQNGCDSIVILTLIVTPTQVSQWDGGAQPWIFGDGSHANPYRIENAGQLAYMSNEINSNSNAYNGSYFELVSDIDLNGYQWIGIGHSSSNPFQGHFDGNNHTIDNLNITVTGSTPVYIGLFGYLDSASVQNVHIIGNGTIDLNTNNTVTYYVGPVAAYLNESQIINCSNTSEINITRTATSTTVYNTYAGGINGYANGRLSLIDQTLSKGNIDYNFNLNYSSSSSYSWYHYIGGTSGYLNNGASIDNSGRVNPINIVSNIRGYYKYSYVYTGGIVGYMTGSSINRVSVRKSYNRGAINLSVLTNHTYSSSSYNMYSYLYAGGIAGYSSAYNTISDCYNRGLITPNLYAQSSYSAAYATNNAYVAGILGFMASTTSFTLANSYNTANIPVTCATSGNATNNYYSDAIVYNTSAYAASNCYHLASCCANNAHYSISKTQSELRALQMIHNLNVGTPGSGIWTSDILPTTNNGYPIFDATPYGYAIYTRPATDITGSSASLNGYIDTNFMDISSLDDIGFEYALIGDTLYTPISSTPGANPMLSLGQLAPCSSYVYRAYVLAGGQYLYGDTISFTILCHTLAQVDTTICHGSPFHFKGQNYLQDGTYYQIVNDTTYTINIHYYPSRENIISTSIMQGQNYYVNGIAYNTSGTYTLRFDTDQHGCDSTVVLTLYVIPTQVSIWQGGAQPWVFGDGSQATPYLIENAAQLAYMSNVINSNSDAYNGAYFRLVSDIDLNGYQWIGIGHSTSNPFQGHFDGDNHTIDNLNITVTGSTPVYIGLFGYLDSASIRNVHIVGNGTIVLNTSNTVTYYVGPVAAYLNESQIINCSNTSDINIIRTASSSTVYNSYVGGINGYATGPLTTIDRTLSKGSIDYNFNLNYNSTTSYTWYHYIGGNVGYLNNGATVNNSGHLNPINIVSDIRGYAKVSYVYTGGVVGYMSSSSANRSSVRRSYNRGQIDLSISTNHTYSSSSYNMYSYAYAGGIVGYGSAYNMISDCYNRADMIPILYTQSSYSSAYATTNAYIGGILGLMASTTSFTLANSYNTANIDTSITTSGNGTNNYYHDAIVYNTTAYAVDNCYHLSNCCTNNAHYSLPKTQNELRTLQMVNNLNVGTPGSAIWNLDRLPYVNNGYPIFDGGTYDLGIRTLPATNITAISATLNGLIDTIAMDLGTITQMGFQYRLQGNASYITIPVQNSANPTTTIGNLIPCSTYTYRAYMMAGGNYIYGDTLNVTLFCHDTIPLNIMTCDGTPYIFAGQTYSIPGTYYQVSNDTTYIINYGNYPARFLSIDTNLYFGNSIVIGGIHYNSTGIYNIAFDTDIHGCDSIVILDLTMRPTLTFGLTAHDAACHGDRNGSITVTPSDGITPYRIEVYRTGNLNTLIGGQNNIQQSIPITISNLAAGNYTIIVTDHEEWSVSDTISIREPLVLSAQLISSTQESCMGNLDGRAIIAVSGGTTPYDYLWSNNETTQNAISLSTGNQTLTVTDNNQCSTILHVQITQAALIQTEFSATQCNSFAWNGQLYNATGNYTQTFPAHNGCDSMVVLHLTITTPTSNHIYQTSCSSYQWFGQQYTSSGTYMHTLSNANSNGCDSIIYLHLTLNQPNINEIYHHSCGMYNWFGQACTETGIYTYTIPNGNQYGCDSILQLHLTVYEPSTNNVTVITDRPYTWNATNATYNESGVYSHTISGGNIHGCDSIVYLYLTVAPNSTGIEESEEALSITVYPNPTQDNLHIQFSGQYQDLKEIELYDIYGKFIHRINITGEQMIIPMATYSHGVYLLCIKDEQSVVQTIKVIKQ